MQSLNKILLVPLMAIAIEGLVLSFALHCYLLRAEFVGIGTPEDFTMLRLGLAILLFGQFPIIFLLHFCVLLAWVPAILLFMTLIQYEKISGPEWSTSTFYAGFPKFVKYSLKVLYFYWWFIFGVGAVYLLSHGKQPTTWPGEWIMFSAGWMLGYAGGLEHAVFIRKHSRSF